MRAYELPQGVWYKDSNLQRLGHKSLVSEPLFDG